MSNQRAAALETCRHLVESGVGLGHNLQEGNFPRREFSGTCAEVGATPKSCHTLCSHLIL